MSRAGRVVDARGSFKYDTGAHYAEVSCKHMERGACGGCYARLFFALLHVEQQPKDAAEIVAGTFREMKGDRS
jgi:hypothetical protein